MKRWSPPLVSPARWICRRKGHDWFPPVERREFLPWESVCLRCGEKNVELPWGLCIGAGAVGAHPLAEHYDSQGHLVHLTCPGPA
jgi:hypothetical protein